MPAKSISRRDFLKAAGITLGASAVTCSGLGYIASRTPEIATPELTYHQENTMNKRILVTYATRCGSTVEVAGAIGKTLSARGFSVDVKPAKEKPQVDGYQAVLVGSAIRFGQWLPEAVEFIKTNQAVLSQVPVALFTVHMMNLGDDEKSTSQRLAYLKDVRPLVKPAAEVFFAGKIDLAQLSFFERTISKMVGSAEGDFRDWDKIRGWAQTVLA